MTRGALGAGLLGLSMVAGMASPTVAQAASTVEDVEAWPERIAAVTPAQVNAAAAYVFDADRSVTGRLSPAPAATAAIEPSGAPPAAALGDREINVEERKVDD